MSTMLSLTVLSTLVAALHVPLVHSQHPVTPDIRTAKTCVVKPGPNGTDSAPAIIQAFKECGHNDRNDRGRVVFQNETYHVETIMNTTGLRNVDVDIHGTLLWGTNITYWLKNSLPMGYQNQSSVWLFGGEGIRWDGHGHGALDGNGQVWYKFIHGKSNYPGRPHQITFSGLKDSVIERVSFLRSQMWTMTLIHASNVLLENIFVNNTAKLGSGTSNTDGADTIYANNITFRNWVVDNGDDSIALKANSTNILIENCQFYDGLGVAIGSIGQYNGVFETIENVTARNVSIGRGMTYGAYVKTWTGISKGYPPNGGGGGLGYAANITLEGFRLDRAAGVFAVTQCTSYDEARGDCDTSRFNIRDVVLRDWTGTADSDVVASLQCSAASPCPGIAIEGLDIIDAVNGTHPANYLCSNVVNQVGFNCTGDPWDENNR